MFERLLTTPEVQIMTKTWTVSFSWLNSTVKTRPALIGEDNPSLFVAGRQFVSLNLCNCLTHSRFTCGGLVKFSAF